MNDHRISSLLPLLLALLLAACSGGQAAEPPLQGANIGGPFALVNQDGKAVTERDFAGRYRLVYFGYTFCPDVCPVDMAVIGQGLRQFEKAAPARGAKVQPIFITVDPARDTPAVLKTFGAQFHPRIAGLTGSPDQIAAAAKAFGVHYARVGDPAASDYLVDHTRLALLLGPTGDPIAIVPHDQGAAAVAAELDKWVT